MIDERRVAGHYANARLLESLREGLARMGKPLDGLAAEDLSAADEFHVGGREASLEFHDTLGWHDRQHLLDVGCGIGGPARLVAGRFGAQVTGLDLTAEYVDTGNVLNGWVGLAGRVRLVQGSALQMPFADGSFDGAYMMHVGMNIADKAALFPSVHRVLRPGATFALYDVMRTGDEEPAFPLPWAETAELSALGTAGDYAQALGTAGFELQRARNRREFALEFFARMRARAAQAPEPPPLGAHLVMGATMPDKIRHLVKALAAGILAPVEMVATRRP